ncbi:hypothetical protein HMPREF9120_00395 [Neisseria sp. oral taxon 020 str. F0370]|nr:hypothetical protein HMPREF9120_00395 [Neisseria sp. oral taxon 020 str. F0370]
MATAPEPFSDDLIPFAALYFRRPHAFYAVQRPSETTPSEKTQWQNKLRKKKKTPSAKH